MAFRKLFIFIIWTVIALLPPFSSAFLQNDDDDCEKENRIKNKDEPVVFTDSKDLKIISPSDDLNALDGKSEGIADKFQDYFDDIFGNDESKNPAPNQDRSTIVQILKGIVSIIETVLKMLRSALVPFWKLFGIFFNQFKSIIFFVIELFGRFFKQIIGSFFRIDIQQRLLSSFRIDKSMKEKIVEVINAITTNIKWVSEELSRIPDHVLSKSAKAKIMNLFHDVGEGIEKNADKLSQEIVNALDEYKKTSETVEEYLNTTLSSWQHQWSEINHDQHSKAKCADDLKDNRMTVNRTNVWTTLFPKIRDETVVH